MLTAKTFRLFISSTFNDFREERRVLQENVFPKIKEYCLEKGLSFQPIDLRWGVSEEAQLDQKTLELCLNEVRACKNHPAPNFLLMLGDRYGWVPLPYHIKKQEFEQIVKNASTDDVEQLNQWYKLDENQLPASYSLQERKGKFKNYKDWSEVESKLRNILQRLVTHTQPALNDHERDKYFQSATEAEIVEGIIPYLYETEHQRLVKKQEGFSENLDTNNIFGFFRNIDPNTSIETINKDDIEFIPDAKEYQQAQELKSRVKATLSSNNTAVAETTQTSYTKLDQTYLDAFEERIKQFLMGGVDARVEVDKIVSEQDLHCDYAKIKTQNFIGQKKALDKIADYCQNVSKIPFMIYGRSGLGKSAIMAKAFLNQFSVDKQKQKTVIRFVGATPNSGDIRSILYLIFEELGIDPRSDQEKAQASHVHEDSILALSEDKQESFKEFSFRMHALIVSLGEKPSQKYTFFIDAVDQLNHSDQFFWLPETLPANVKIIISTLDDEAYEEDSVSYKTLSKAIPQENQEAINPFQENHAKELLTALLEKEHRMLQPDQENYVLQQFKTSPTPLYLQLVVQEVKHWKSYDLVQNQSYDNSVSESSPKIQDLQPTQKGIVNDFINNLSHFYHHDKRLVYRVLGYFYASKDGLSEHELLELINQDTGFINEIASDEFHTNELSELPFIIWARLLQYISPFLGQKTQDGEVLLYFFHREFETVISELAGLKEIHQKAIGASQQIIKSVQNKPFNKNRWGKLYSAFVVQFDMAYADEICLKNAAYALTKLNEVWLQYLISALTNFNREPNRTYLAKSLNRFVRLLCKKLYENSPEKWAWYYRASINNLACTYEELNQPERALLLTEEALVIDKVLYEASPEECAELYEDSLMTLACTYEELNQPERALPLKQDALAIVKGLYEASPEEWAWNYLDLLTSLAYTYRELNQPEKALALELEEEALAIHLV